MLLMDEVRTLAERRDAGAFAFGDRNINFKIF
jgi:hypothetical protein